MSLTLELQKLMLRNRYVNLWQTQDLNGLSVLYRQTPVLP